MRTTSEQAGGVTAFDTRFLSITDHTDSRSMGRYTHLTQDQSGGQVVPGSATSYGVAGYDYGGGHSVYIHH